MKTIKNKQAIPETLEGCQFLFMGLDDLLGKLDNVDNYPVSKSNYRVELLCDAIRKQGILSPIMVQRIRGSEARYRLIDGMKRIYCAIEHRISPIPVLMCDKVSNLNEASTLALNNIRFKTCGFTLLNFVYMLVNENGVEIKQIAKSTMRSTKTIKNWISAMNKFYTVIYPQFSVSEWNKFIEFAEKECFTPSRLMFCINLTNSPERLENCLIGKIQPEGLSDAKTIREIRETIKKTGVEPEQMRDALVVYDSINRNYEKMPEECKKWINKALRGELGDENGDDEQ